MAGLIAGHDSTLSAPYSQAPASAYRGVAPDARIISVKVGTSDGGADVTQVIAAIDWVVQHAHDPGFNIRVISLSYGTDSTQPYTVDPLAFAAEQAWKHGIVVVAAAGNTGFQRGNGAPGLADPAYDPYVIGVGGVDTQGTATFADDTMGSYSASSNGDPGTKNPDFVAPGSHLQGLRVPGSYIDDEAPAGILDSTYMRGSGTSEATAITAGAIALILQKYPGLTPDQVKQFIDQDAQPVRGADPTQQGAGELDLAAMLNDAPQGYAKPASQPTPSGGPAGPALAGPAGPAGPGLAAPGGPAGNSGPGPLGGALKSPLGGGISGSGSSSSSGTQNLQPSNPPTYTLDRARPARAGTTRAPTAPGRSTAPAARCSSRRTARSSPVRSTSSATPSTPPRWPRPRPPGPRGRAAPGTATAGAATRGARNSWSGNSLERQQLVGQ